MPLQARLMIGPKFVARFLSCCRRTATAGLAMVAYLETIPNPDPLSHESHIPQRFRVSQWLPALRQCHSSPLLHPRASHTGAHIAVGAYGEPAWVLSMLLHPVRRMPSSVTVTISAERASRVRDLSLTKNCIHLQQTCASWRTTHSDRFQTAVWPYSRYVADRSCPFLEAFRKSLTLKALRRRGGCMRRLRESGEGGCGELGNGMEIDRLCINDGIKGEREYMCMRMCMCVYVCSCTYE
jgi:hypothetical protein